MAQPGLPPDTLVSFWRDPSSTSRENFHCSGVFVGDGLILTVKHAFDDDPELWVRPNTPEAIQAYPLKRQREEHPTCDAALVGLDIMPLLSRTAPLDRNGSSSAASLDRLTINGYFDGKYEAPQELSVLSYEETDRLYITDLKQPRGQSGSGIARGRLLWGIASCHFSDPGVHRGCVVPISLLWEGWLESFVKRHAPQSWDVARRAEDIRHMVGLNQIEDAKNQLMDFASDFGTDAHVDQSVSLSQQWSDFVPREAKLRQSEAMKMRCKFGNEILKLRRDILERHLP
jgi:hypothetical protein